MKPQTKKLNTNKFDEFDDKNYIVQKNNDKSSLYTIQYGDLYNQNYTMVFFKNKGQAISFFKSQKNKMFGKKK